MKDLNASISRVSLVTLLSFFALGVNAQNDGDIDPTFGSGGTVTTNLNQVAYLNDMEVQADNKVIIVGQTMDEATSALLVGMVARFNENGTLDPTFSGNGYVNSGFMRNINAVELLPDGKMIVAGHSFLGNASVFCVSKLNPDGSLDSATFNGGGTVRTMIGLESHINAIKILPDGKILAVGETYSSDNSGWDIAIARYNADGSLDKSFGEGGVVTVDLGSEERIYDVAVLPNGRVLVVGSYVHALPDHIWGLMVRFNVDGSIDTTFGDQGKVFHTADTPVRLFGVVIQNDGRIIVVGQGIPPVRYVSNGTFDTAFNTPTGQFTLSVSIESTGKILVGGGATQNDGSLVRYNNDGTPDGSFGIGGIVPTQFFGSEIAYAPDGKIVLGSGNGGGPIVLSRYFSGFAAGLGWLDFDGDGRTDVSIFRPSVGEWWYLRSSDGGNVAAQFGAGTDVIVPGDFTGDGKSDFAFFRLSTGEWFVLRSEDFSFYAFPFGTGTDIPAPADYDGDGQTDPAVFRPSTGTWFIYRSSDGQVTITTFGVEGDQPIPADFDGDGFADVGIFRPNGTNGAEWWISCSTEGLLAAQFGQQTDKAAAGDYTGDGKTDVAFFRPSSGEWFVLRSEDFSFYAFPFGTLGDLPAPGDYDGDGRMDAAVFRPSSATWFMQGSTSGTMITTWGVPGDRPVPNAFVR